MKIKSFNSYFNMEIVPYLAESHPNDKPALRMTYNDAKDAAMKNGELTYEQCQNMLMPKYIETNFKKLSKLHL